MPACGDCRGGRGALHRPHGPNGRAGFQVDLIRARTREGKRVAKTKGCL